MEHEIIKLLNTITSDHVYRQVYAYEVKMLFEMLKETQSHKLSGESFKTPPLNN